MTTSTTHDPAMCISTGLCGIDIDPKRIDLTADLDRLKGNRSHVQHFGLSPPSASACCDATHEEFGEASGGSGCASGGRAAPAKEKAGNCCWCRQTIDLKQATSACTMQQQATALGRRREKKSRASRICAN